MSGQDKKAKDKMRHEERLAEIHANAHKSADRVMAEAQIKNEEKKARKETPWMFDDFFYNLNSISEITFPDTPEDISKTVERINETVKNKLDTYINKEISMGVKDLFWFALFGWVFKITTVVQALFGEPAICKEARTALDKSRAGIKKLRVVDADTRSSHLSTEVDNLGVLIQVVSKRNTRVYIIKAVLALILWSCLLGYNALPRKYKF